MSTPKAEEWEGEGKIPVAEFIEDIPKFMKEGKFGNSADSIIKSLQNLHNVYDSVTKHLMARKAKLLRQVPDLTSTLEVLDHVIDKTTDGEVIDTDFQLSESVYGRAKIQPSETVCLWLGANVMLEYETSEAHELLAGNLKTAQDNLKEIASELSFLRQQLTTTEVNMARVYNFDVQQRREGSEK